MTIYVKDSGSWSRVKGVYKKESGTWELVDQGIYVKESGVWENTHPVGFKEFTSTGSQTFTVPDGVYYMKLYGAGAGGGASGAYFSTAGQGGGGGGYVDGVLVECTPSSTITINIGTGGNGVQFGNQFCPCNGYDGGNTTISGLTVTGNVTASTITLNGGGGGKGATQSGYPASNGGSTSGITGGTSGQAGQGSGSNGRGGKSLGGAFDSNGYGTAQGNIGCWGYDGDSAYGTGKGAGGCGVPDVGGCGYGGGGSGADGYVKFEWNYDYS